MATARKIAPQWPRSPYPGLRPFSVSEDADESLIFFGRDKQVNALVDRLSAAHMVSVIGPSGCGKSSLVRAGLIPRLRSGYVEEAGSRWLTVEIEPGREPIAALARALSKVATAEGADAAASSPESIEACLREGSDPSAPLPATGLAEFIEWLHDSIGARKNILILVDQFEELFRRDLCSQEDAIWFINLLLYQFYNPQDGLYVVTTMRTDSLEECARYQGLPEALNETSYLTPRMDAGGLREAIQRPAELEHFGGSVERTLVRRLIDEADQPAYDPDSLPLLQHALAWMWDRTAGKEERPVELRLDDYTPRFGSIADCLNQHAEEIYAGLTSDQKSIAETMMRLLTGNSRGSERGRRRATTIAEIERKTGARSEQIVPIVQAFADASFLRRQRDGTIDVTHESFIRQWKTFAEVAETELRTRRDYLDLASRAHKQNMLEHKEFLSASEIDEVDRWWNPIFNTEDWADVCLALDRNREVASYAETRRFLDESREDLKNKRRRQRNQTALMVLALGFGWVAVGLLLLFWTIYQGEIREQKADLLFRLADSTSYRNDSDHRLVAIYAKRLARSGSDVCQKGEKNLTVYCRTKRFLESKNGEAIADEIPTHGLRIRSLSISPDGSRLAAVGSDSAVRIWPIDGLNEAPREVVADSNEEVIGVALSSGQEEDGSIAVVGVGSGVTLRIVKLDSKSDGQRIPLPGFPAPSLNGIRSIAWNSSSGQLALWQDDIVHVWTIDLEGGTVTRAESSDPRFSSAGQQVASTFNSNGQLVVAAPDRTWFLDSADSILPVVGEFQNEFRVGVLTIADHNGDLVAVDGNGLRWRRQSRGQSEWVMDSDQLSDLVGRAGRSSAARQPLPISPLAAVSSDGNTIVTRFESALTVWRSHGDASDSEFCDLMQPLSLSEWQMVEERLTTDRELDPDHVVETCDNETFTRSDAENLATLGHVPEARAHFSGLEDDRAKKLSEAFRTFLELRRKADRLVESACQQVIMSDRFSKELDGIVESTDSILADNPHLYQAVAELRHGLAAQLVARLLRSAADDQAPALPVNPTLSLIGQLDRHQQEETRSWEINGLLNEERCSAIDNLDGAVDLHDQMIDLETSPVYWAEFNRIAKRDLCYFAGLRRTSAKPSSLERVSNWCDEAVDQSPDDPRAYRSRAVFEASIGRFRDAGRDLAEAVDKSRQPENPLDRIQIEALRRDENPFDESTLNWLRDQERTKCGSHVGG